MVMRISGLASGMDTDTIIKQLMTAQRVPLDKLAQKKQQLEWKRDDYRTLNNKVLEFRNAAFDMKLQAGYLSKKVSNSDDSIVSVSAGTSSTEGQYTMRVERLAKAAGFSTGTLDGAAGGDQTLATKLQLAGTGNKLTINGSATPITLDGTESLDSMIKKINDQSATTGVKATYDTTMDRIFFTTVKTGSEAKIDLKLTNAAGDPVYDLSNAFNMDGNGVSGDEGVVTGDTNTDVIASTITVTGIDAIVHFNGVKATYASNTMTIGGLTFTAKKESATTVDVGVTQDTDKVFDTIKAFVDKYNSLIDEVNKETIEKKYRDFVPLTDEQKEEMTEDEIKKWEEKARSGMLSNDALLTRGMQSLRRGFSDAVSGLSAGTLSSLSQIGISNVNLAGSSISGTYADNGKLYIDETKLKTALSEKPDEVMALFTTDNATESNDGIATRLYDKAAALFKQITDKAGASTSSETSYLMGKENIQITKDMARLEDRLADLETRYYKQYTAMEKFISSMNSQSSWLTQQFSQ